MDELKQEEMKELDGKKAVNDLIEKGKKKGSLSASDMDEVIADLDMDSLEELYEALEDNGVSFGESLSSGELDAIETEVESFVGGENIERQLRVGIVQYLNNMQASVKKYHASAATVNQAQRGYDISVKRYDVGRGTLVDIDNSQVALTQAEMSRNQSIYNFLTAKVSLDKVLGNFEF
jgi:hypothetical protein